MNCIIPYSTFFLYLVLIWSMFKFNSHTYRDYDKEEDKEILKQRIGIHYRERIITSRRNLLILTTSILICIWANSDVRQLDYIKILFEENDDWKLWTSLLILTLFMGHQFAHNPLFDLKRVYCLLKL